MRLATAPQRDNADCAAAALASQPSFTFVLPESFDPGDFLRTPHLENLHDDAWYLIHLILTKTARGIVDTLGLVRLHAKFLRNVMSFRGYSAVVDALLEHGAIERFPYAVGERSFGYRLTKRFVADKHVRVPATDRRLIARLDAFHARAELDRLSRMKPVHHALANQQNRLQIDGDSAREIIAALPASSNPFDVQGILVADIERKEFHCNVGRYGRVSNNVTSLKREVRTALHVRGKPLASVDVSCAQPALIGKIIRDSQQATGQREGGEQATGQGEGRARRGRPAAATTYDVHHRLPTFSKLANFTDDFELYQCLVQTGRLYDHMLTELRRAGVNMPRDVFKRRFLCDVLAKRKANRRGAEYPSVVEDSFSRRFPTVYRFIREFNRNGWEHENLIRELQRQESRLVIETVAADLVRRYPATFFLTLHDAIYTTHDHVGKVEQAFHRAFDRNGFPMTVKVAA